LVDTGKAGCGCVLLNRDGDRIRHHACRVDHDW
jgi:hypothetical protein